ncbi:replication-relaxation family protein [Actinomadura parmotrematis]|uniref:Replication-relaxation family protein n=1 Tax=Actinomadura parmotrematis TaxID=2864039 RepID=A0ABS7G3J8_9ACTN|nr:replication-relaxation family protein [Actinomadura parmotrematis]MBW8487293.1 replication-relaxation family protein [Actinomadura parmotrematis]
MSIADGPARRTGRKVSAALLERLTERDLEVLALVWEHRVFTTDQIAKIFFPSVSATRQRLIRLYRMQALIRHQPWSANGTGTVPYRWALGPAGAQILAIRQGVTLKELRYRPEQAAGYLLSRTAHHQLGVNGFFADLHATARRSGRGCRVAEWWSERHCARLWGLHARPDAFGRWEEPAPDTSSGPPASVEFFLEHDTGTEPLDRVTAKLTGYAKLAAATGINTPLLLWLPNATREANLRRLLATPKIPVATAVQTAEPAPVLGAVGDGPAGPVWLPAGVTGPRRRLAALTDAWDAPDRPRGDR